MGLTDIERKALKSAGTALVAEPLTVRLTEASRISGFSRSDLYRRAAAGEIVFLKAGRSTLVTMESLRAAIAALPRAAIRGA